ncbi:MAG: UDP-N-acetylglucosamine 2-epimerase (non-hydrolyzing) [Candidatus Caldatribacteriota bacterium]
MKKIKIAVIFGTRPEAIKVYPVIQEIKKYSDKLDLRIIVTAQHREMLDQMLKTFKIKPDYDLNIMQEKQTLTQITKNSLQGIEEILKIEKPDMVLVQGDTTTTFTAALAAFYQRIKIGHIEAGLRTRDKYYPFPEEINRRLTTVLADLHFVPTQNSCQNLLSEGIKRENIYISGNTVIDTLFLIRNRKYSSKLKNIFKNEKLEDKRFILVTAHRRENWGVPLYEICQALSQLVKDYPEITIIFPVHKNPLIKTRVQKILGNKERVILLDTLDYPDMVKIMLCSYIILTDSGGIQEEAPSLGKPVLVLRNETERPEAVDAGVVKVIGTNAGKIYQEVKELLDFPEKYAIMAQYLNPYGDGKAAFRIIQRILYYYDLKTKYPEEFKFIV